MLDIYLTKDGSPTLIFKKTDESGQSYEEKMHHSEGAWAETLYIYCPALKKSFEFTHAKVLSLGLGLGYNEVMATALELRSNPKSPVVIHSYELLDELRDDFSQFVIQGRSEIYSDCYKRVFELVAQEFSLSSEELRLALRRKIENKELQLLEAFPQAMPLGQTYNCLLYDAFSSKMHPELWGEEFLTQTFSKICEENCVLTTYAATGALKRSLRALGFEKVERPGFAGKRDSSFYFRSRETV